MLPGCSQQLEVLTLRRIDNFVPGKMDELGIGYDALSKANPSIIHASISGDYPSSINLEIPANYLQATEPADPMLNAPDTILLQRPKVACSM